MYYKKKLENKKLSEFYFAYLAGLQWIYYYYSNGISNYNWMYKYHYVPFISDLSNFEISENFKELIDKKIIDINSKPLSSYALSCLTFNDKNFDELLPKQFSKVKKVLNSYFRDVNKSKIDLNGEIFIRNGYLLQPFITSKQLNDLNKTITEIYKDLSENYKQLNAVKKSIIFHKNKNLLDNIDNEYMINLINLFKEKCITLNSNMDEMRNNFNYYIDNFSNELFIDINKNYMPYIKDKEKNNFILKIKNIFDIFINYNISKEEYDIDIKFNKDILEGNNNNKDMILNMNKFTDVAYPRINYLSYEYNEETTKLEFGKKYKFTKITKALKITILSKFTNIINENNKNEIIENILNQKIVLYDIPMKKIGIIEGVFYNDKYYYLNEDKIEGIQSDEIRQNLKYQKSFLDYEKSNIFIKIKDIKVIKDKNNENINLIEIINSDNLINFNLSIIIPIEFTSLNIQKEDDIFKNLLNDINSIKIFYEKCCEKNENTNSDIELKFQCCTFPHTIIIKADYKEIFENVEKKLIMEEKDLGNKELLFLSNGQKVDKTKTVKENNLIENPHILIIANEPTKDVDLNN